MSTPLPGPDEHSWQARFLYTRGNQWTVDLSSAVSEFLSSFPKTWTIIEFTDIIWLFEHRSVRSEHSVRTSYGTLHHTSQSQWALLDTPELRFLWMTVFLPYSPPPPALSHPMVYLQRRKILFPSIFGLHCVRMSHFKNCFLSGWFEFHLKKIVEWLLAPD